MSGYEKASRFANSVSQDMEMVPGYGNGIGLGWYKKASEFGNGMHHALLDKLSS